MAAGGSDFVLGIDFGGTKVALATATAAGVPVHSARLATNAIEGAAQVLDRSFACAQELIAATE
ncbi:MAG: ROK family protein, partial [Solirubrobacteraceae bacterium]